MKKLLLLKPILLLFALIVGVGSAWAEDTTVSYGWEDSDDATKWTITEAIVKTSGQGNTGTYAGKINTNHTYVQFKEKVYVKSFSFAFKRTSNNNNYNVYIETSTDGETWTAVETYAMSSFGNGSYTTKTHTFDGTKEYYVRFHCYNTTAVRYVDDVTITYSNSAANPACAAPSFEPVSGTYTSSQDVTISSETEGAEIYYTMGDNPADPTTSSNKYTSPITVDATTTIKAIAVAEGYENSAVVTAKYVFLEHAGTEADPYSVTDARAAIDAETGTEGVYATGIVSEIVTAYSSDYSNITFNFVDATGDEVFLQAYRCSGNEAADVTVGDVVVVSGNLIKYGTTYEFAQGCQLVSLTHPTVTTPVIKANDVEIEYNATAGEIPYTIENPETDKELTATTTAEWISNVTVASDKVTFTTTVNESNADRTATFTLSYPDAVDKTVTVTQKHFVPDYATLPFTFDGGRADIASTVGLTQDGLDSDYSSSPKLKFNGTGDWVILKINEVPGELTFDILGNSFSSSTFKVQESADGVNYTDLETYTELSSTKKSEELSPASTTRYIKWIYTSKSSGNVALGNITLAKPDYTPSITVSPSAVEVSADGDDGTITVTCNNMGNDPVLDVAFYNAEGEAAEYDWLDAEIDGDNNLYYVIDANEGEARTAYMKVHGLNGDAMVYSQLITITQAAYVAPFEGATYTLASSITPGKHYIITNGEDKAMGAQNENNRAAVDVTINEDVATVESANVFEFVIYGPDADGNYTIFDAKNDGYLYAASTSKNYLKTHTDYTGDARWEITFENESGAASIVAKGSNTHNVMQYNSGSTLFSCYESASQSSVYLYEKDGDTAPTTESVTVSSVSYATYSSEFALDFSNTDNITVYTAKANGTSVKLTEVSDGIVPAYTGVVLYANGGASAPVPVATSTSGTTWTDNEMVANVKRAIVKLAGADGKTNYILSNETDGVGFYKAAANGAYLPANRAYLSTTATATGNAPFLGFDEGTTGIVNVNGETITNNQYYTLDGRRVENPSNGIYIVNGKKVVVK